ncbi:DUF4269 domain-containing protein [Myroides pelagicus]|uniref:DUF4269 domain-containing protein n=1 Tax=Myroides pelagicus TaxID=270914 RepID=A0A7K1GN60_9FLAO|nr:DUF4269 domain-containing protein [Myroides pelagicus]MEC4113381.1 DUF4269 domain-containing protein [Myroides pelagicus]MTH30281.1 DUF4269 domain-containing protein [Myroides pelagicus]
MNFRDLSYLQTGTAVQQEIYQLLDTHQVMQILAIHDPVLIGTYPIDIAIASSDLDICCTYQDKVSFISLVNRYFGHYPGYQVREKQACGEAAVVVGFFIGTYEVELFAQSIPVESQNGYRHMLVEHQLLVQQGEAFKQAIIALKEAGLKTEPAFAKLLNLQGDPYEALLQFGQK